MCRQAPHFSFVNPATVWSSLAVPDRRPSNAARRRTAAVIALAASLIPCSLGAGTVVLEREAMGTRCRIVCHADDTMAASRACEDAYARVKQIEGVLSDRDVTSETLRLADAPTGKPAPIGTDLRDILATSLELARETDGAFDPTVGPLTKLWRRARMRKAFPDAASVAKARESVGWQHLTLDAKASTLTLARTGMRLDFGGIGKGWAADQALASLRKAGFPRSSVSLSGDIAVGDAPPGADAWEVRIQPPSGPGRIHRIANRAISTSGDSEQNLEHDGKTWSHIVDPRTGWPLTHRRWVVVEAPSATLSDSLATACSVLPHGAAESIARRHGATVEIITPAY